MISRTCSSHMIVLALGKHDVKRQAPVISRDVTTNLMKSGDNTVKSPTVSNRYEGGY